MKGLDKEPAYREEEIETKGPVFSPEAELKKIGKLPREEKLEALEKFKEKLAWQKEGIAEMQQSLIETIRKNPDIAPEKLVEESGAFADKYELDAKQRRITKFIINQYAEKHKKIEEVREQHPDDKDLFNYIFGREPKGEVEVIKGPMTLYFRCHNLEDYTYIRTQAFLNKRDVTHEEMEIANKSIGVSVPGSRISGLMGTIIAEKALGRPFDDRSKETFIHEEQHAFKKLFREGRSEITTLEELENVKNYEEFKTKLRRYFLGYMKDHLVSAKDEILAYSKEGKLSANEIFEILTRSKEEGGLYDYFFDLKPRLEQRLVEYLGDSHEEVIKDISKDVFEKEYGRYLLAGISALARLKSNGYSIDLAINILIKEPLDKWPRTVDILLKKNVLK